MSYVTKRNGKREPVSFDKIIERIARLINPSELQSFNVPEISSENDFLDPVIVAQKVIANLYSGMTTQELDLQSAAVCQNMSTVHPSYSKLGGRILISNLHKSTLNTFSEKVNVLAKDTNIMHQKFVDYVLKNKERLDNLIDYNRDYFYEYFGFKTLEKSSLFKSGENIIERPQDMLMRVAVCLHIDYTTGEANFENIKKTYELNSMGYYTHASPTMYNAGTVTMQLSSCFLGKVPDSLKGIRKAWGRCAEISKWAGGIGLSVSDVRSKDAPIKGTRGTSGGLVPQLKIFDQIARGINQGGKRPGSIAIYLEPHHPDIFDFLDLRKNFGDDTQRARDLFLALWTCDLFMKQVEADGDWYLLCPSVCPGLSDVFGDEYEKMYWDYVNAGKYKTKITARKLWLAILDSQIETGMPYIGFKDSINKKSNQKNLGTIKNSNLCVHGETQILTTEGYRIIKDLENKKTSVWNGLEWSEVEIKKTGSNVNLIRVALSNGAYLDCTPEHIFYKKNMEKIEACCLKIGDELLHFELPDKSNFNLQNDDSSSYKYWYTKGMFSAVGHTKNGLNFIKLKNDKKGLLDKLMYMSYMKHDKKLTILTHAEITKDIPMNYDENVQIAWLRGLIDGIGEDTIDECKFKIYKLDKVFLLNVRLMLHTLGIESSYLMIENCLLIENYYYKVLTQLILGNANVNVHGSDTLTLLNERNNMPIYNPTVDTIKESYKNVDTYCFTEEKRHMGIFNGIITGQCIEIAEYSDDKEYAVCNLASISLRHFVKPFINDKTNKWIIYTKPNCKFCSYAKKYLTYHKYEFQEVQYSEKNISKLKNILQSQTVTFPQIFVNEETINNHVGGWSELYAYTAGKFDYNKLYEVAYTATLNLNKVIDINFYPIPQTKLSNMKHRPIGLGIQGLADTLAMMRIPFDSTKAVELNAKIMEMIYLASVTASNDLAKERNVDFTEFYELTNKYQMNISKFPEFYDDAYPIYNDDDKDDYYQYVDNNGEGFDYYQQFCCEMKKIGELYHKLKPNIYELTNLPGDLSGAYSSFVGSYFSEGKFQFDLWDIKPSMEEKWDSLRKSVIKYGTRNSLLTALMPTASTSQILGNNECFEYFTNNIYTRNTQAGDFVMMNKYLVGDMLSVGMWNTEMKDKIIASNGSVQPLDILPPQFRELYKTMWEIQQVWVLEAALARSPYVDQTQSMNLFMAKPDYQRLGSSHMWAWKHELKTGQYYLRTKPSTDAIKFTIDPRLINENNKQNNEVKNEDNNGCENCSA